MLNERFAQWTEVKGTAERFCFATADSEWQAQALDRLRQEIERFSEYLADAIADETLEDHDSNCYYCGRMALQEVEAELEMWIALREGRPSDAWDRLIDAQKLCHWLLTSCDMITNIRNRFVMLECLERILFPPQVFSSPGMIASYKCTICDQPIELCDHIRGRLYRGRPCEHEATHVDFVEFSLVLDPSDKGRRIVSYTEGKITMDKLTNGPVRKPGESVPSADGNANPSVPPSIPEAEPASGE